MTPDLAALRKLAENATPGPNSTGGENGYGGPAHIITGAVCEACRKRNAPCLGPNEPNAAYIAALDPQTVLRLLDAAALASPERAAVVEAAKAWRDARTKFDARRENSIDPWFRSNDRLAAAVDALRAVEPER